jgi:hypothetical protein
VKWGAHEVEAFLTHLAVAGRFSASTQNQAKSALLFLYKEVLETELPGLDDVESAKAACHGRWRESMRLLHTNGRGSRSSSPPGNRSTPAP